MMSATAEYTGTVKVRATDVTETAMGELEVPAGTPVGDVALALATAMHFPSDTPYALRDPATAETYEPNRTVGSYSMGSTELQTVLTPATHLG